MAQLVLRTVYNSPIYTSILHATGHTHYTLSIAYVVVHLLAPRGARQVTMSVPLS